jgi:hypothetical protein
VDDTISEYRTDQNTVVAWFEERVVVSNEEKDSITVREGYLDYVSWCSSSKTKHESVIKFGRDISRFYKIRAKTQIDKDRKTVKTYHGIKMALQPNF